MTVVPRNTTSCKKSCSMRETQASDSRVALRDFFNAAWTSILVFFPRASTDHSEPQSQPTKQPTGKQQQGKQQQQQVGDTLIDDSITAAVEKAAEQALPTTGVVSVSPDNDNLRVAIRTKVHSAWQQRNVAGARARKSDGVTTELPPNVCLAMFNFTTGRVAYTTCVSLCGACSAGCRSGGRRRRDRRRRRRRCCYSCACCCCC
jgi:hypothetical protein